MDVFIFIFGAVFSAAVGIFAMTWDEIIPAVWRRLKAGWHDFSVVHNHSAEDF